MDELFFYLADMIPNMSPTARQSLLDGGNRMRLLKALEHQNDLLAIVESHCQRVTFVIVLQNWALRVLRCHSGISPRQWCLQVNLIFSASR